MLRKASPSRASKASKSICNLPKPSLEEKKTSQPLPGAGAKSLLELISTEVPSSHTQHEAHSVHQVGLPSAIGAFELDGKRIALQKRKKSDSWNKITLHLGIFKLIENPSYIGFMQSPLESSHTKLWKLVQMAKLDSFKSWISCCQKW